MKKLLWLFGLLMFLPASVIAHEVGGGKLSGSLTLASDYVFRSESETADGEIPTVQGNFTWSHQSGGYIGYFTSTNKFTSAPDIYAVSGPYIGYSGKVDSIKLDYNVFHFWYQYPGATRYNYSELWMQVSKSFNKDKITLEVTPTTANWFGVDGWNGTNYAITYQRPINKVTVAATIGKQELTGSGAQGWQHWNIAARYPWHNYTFTLSYHNSDVDSSHKVYGSPEGIAIFDARLVWAISASF